MPVLSVKNSVKRRMCNNRGDVNSPLLQTKNSTQAKHNTPPPRITKLQLQEVLNYLIKRSAKSDVEAERLIAVVQSGIVAAPRGYRQGRAWLQLEWPNGQVERLLGAPAAATRLGLRSAQHVRNMLSKGKGTAAFPRLDEHGNPAFVYVRRIKSDAQ
jgi:hypothetical protein